MRKSHDNRTDTQSSSVGIKTKNPYRFRSFLAFLWLLLVLCVAVLMLSVLQGNIGISVTITFEPQVKESPSPGNNNKGISVIKPDSQVPESDVIMTESSIIEWLQLGSLLQQRVMPLDRKKFFSFVHISKAGGTQWWFLIVETLGLQPSQKNFREICQQQQRPCQLFPPVASGPSYELPLLDTLASAPHANYILISLRSPLHHVFSQYSHCRYFKSHNNITRTKTVQQMFQKRNKKNNKNVPMGLNEGFEKWLSFFVTVKTEENRVVSVKKDDDALSNNIQSAPSFLSSPSYRLVESYDRHTCYNPINAQSRFLTASKREQEDIFSLEPAPTESIANLRRHTHFVGVLDFYHESKCLFYHRTMMLKMTSKTKRKSDDMEVVQRIQDYLDERCRCPWPEAVFNEKKVEHHKEGKRKTMVGLNSRVKEMVATVAGKDIIMYKSALMDFFHEILWLESPAQLDRRVMCDESLQKQELELAYLGLNVSHLYSYAKAKIGM